MQTAVNQQHALSHTIQQQTHVLAKLLDLDVLLCTIPEAREREAGREGDRGGGEGEGEGEREPQGPPTSHETVT
jgi:hypothetical protein